MYKEMLNELIEILKENHIDIYFNITEEELDKIVEDILLDYKLEDDYDFYYVSNMLIKKIFGIYDSHTMVAYKGKYTYTPIRFKKFNDRIYVININENSKELLFGELLKINEIEINKLMKELENIICYSTNEWLDVNVEKKLAQVPVLLSLPSINNSSKEITYTIKQQNGYICDVSYNTNFDDIFKFAKRYDFDSGKKYNYTYSIDNDIMTIVYSSCREEYEGQMVNFVKEIEEKAIENNISNYIVDIRGNTGGNSNIIKPLIEYLKDKNIITLVDKNVFSSGRFALMDLKNIGSKFVGTGIGTTLNCFGNIKVNELGNFLVASSNKYFYYDENDDMLKTLDKKDQFEEFKLKKENLKYFIPQIFKPDYYVENNLNDYINNNDSMKEYAYGLINPQINKSKR